MFLIVDALSDSESKIFFARKEGKKESFRVDAQEFH